MSEEPFGERPLELRWLGAACVHLRWGNAEAVFDPFLSRPAGADPVAHSTPEELGRASLLLVSHGHFDHALDALAVARVTHGTVCAPAVVCRRLARGAVARARLRANERGGAFEWAGGRVTVLASRHIRFDRQLVMRTVGLAWRGGVVRRLLPLLAGYPAGSNSDFLLELGSHRLLFSGSGGGDFTRLRRHRPSCFLLPFAGRTDVCDYYVRALRILRPAQVVLHHFDRFYPSFAISYPVEEMRRRMATELPDVQLFVPTAGQWFTLPVAQARPALRAGAEEPANGLARGV